MTKIARVAAIVEEERGKTILVLGPGDHTCERWEISGSLLDKLILEGVQVRLSRNGSDHR